MWLDLYHFVEQWIIPKQICMGSCTCERFFLHRMYLFGEWISLVRSVKLLYEIGWSKRRTCQRVVCFVDDFPVFQLSIERRPSQHKRFASYVSFLEVPCSATRSPCGNHIQPTIRHSSTWQSFIDDGILPSLCVSIYRSYRW